MKHGQALLDELLAEKQRTGEQQAQREDNIYNCQYDPEDCMLSTWANGMSTQLLNAKIEILQNGGLHPFPALLTPDGQDTGATLHYVRSRFSYGEVAKWRLPDGTWITDGPRATKKAGYVRGTAMRPAWAKLDGSGHGLAGAMSVYVRVFPSKWNWWTGEGTEDSCG